MKNKEDIQIFKCDTLYKYNDIQKKFFVATLYILNFKKEKMMYF